MRKLLLAPLAALVLAGGCVHTPPTLAARQTVRADSAEFRLEFDPADAGDAAMVRKALLAAVPKVARWGGLRAPVRVQLLPTHEGLERAARQSDLPWLRAWARQNVIFVQTPESWENGRASQLQLDELVLHELTHCVMYQQAASDSTWQRKRIPVWFREGMASVTADQGYRRGSLVELHRRISEGEDPLDGAHHRMRHEQQTVYTAGHHAFAFLVRHHGDAAVRRLLARMREGEDFDRAFADAFGTERRRFEDEFRGFLRAEEWRAGPGSTLAPGPRPLSP